jgi:hypothetical protein
VPLGAGLLIIPPIPSQTFAVRCHKKRPCSFYNEVIFVRAQIYDFFCFVLGRNTIIEIVYFFCNFLILFLQKAD